MIRVAFSVVGFLVAFIFSPLSFSDTTALRSAEIELAKMSYHLQKCRESCLTNCRASGASTCSEDVCDRGMCKTAKQAYDMSKQATHGATSPSGGAKAGTDKPKSILDRKESGHKGRSKIRFETHQRGPENMGLYVVMGVGTTALLTYMAAKCCKAAFGGGSAAGGGSGGGSAAGGGVIEVDSVPSGIQIPNRGVSWPSGSKLRDSDIALKRFYTWLTGAGLDFA